MLTPGPISSGLVHNHVPAAPVVPPSTRDLEILFQPMYDEYFEPANSVRYVPQTPAAVVPCNPTGPSISMTIDQEAPSTSNSSPPGEPQSSSTQLNAAGNNSLEANPFSPTNEALFVNIFIRELSSDTSSSQDVIVVETNQSSQPHEHL